MTGRLIGVGVGPGDPGLLTLKAVDAIKAADVIAYFAKAGNTSNARTIVEGHLNGATELPLLYPVTTEIPKEDTAYREAITAFYDSSAKTVAQHLDAGRDVAILSEGDPFFYGSFMYLFGRMAERFPVEVVPGVSSLTACAAVLGAPLAARNDVLTVVPAPLDEAVLKTRLAATEAVAVIKLGRHFAKVRRVLDELGLVGQARYVEHATMASQRILALDAVAEDGVPYFSMILVHKRGEAWT